MFVYCGYCGYDSGDFDSMEELKSKVKTDGGSLITGLDSGACICPECEIRYILIDY